MGWLAWWLGQITTTLLLLLLLCQLWQHILIFQNNKIKSVGENYWLLSCSSFLCLFFANNLVILGQSLAPPPFHYYRNPLPSPSEKPTFRVENRGSWKGES